MLSDQLSIKQGPLSRVWLASHWERKISKAQFLHTNLNTAIDYISTNQSQEPIALRLSGQLLLGVVRIHSRKTRYLLEDCNGALSKIKTAFKQGNVNLTDATTMKASIDAITLPEQQLNDIEPLLPDTLWITREHSGSDPLLDDIQTQDMTLMGTQDTFLSFNATIEQGRLLDQAEHQHVEFDSAQMNDIEMARRDNEPDLLDRSFSADLNDGPIDKMQHLHLDEQQNRHQEMPDFDFDFGGGADDNHSMNLGDDPSGFPVPFNRYDNNDASLDTLMQSGIVPVDESEQIVFGIDQDDTFEQQPARRRRRLVVDKVTEIPREELKRYMLDVSSLIDKTINDTPSSTQKLDTTVNLRKPTGCMQNSDIETIITRWNTQHLEEGIITADEEDSWAYPVDNHQTISDTATPFDPDNDIDFDFGFNTNEDVNINTINNTMLDDSLMDQANIFDTELSFSMLDDDEYDVADSQAYDATQQSTLGTRAQDTMENLQRRFLTQKSVGFDTLAREKSSKKADVARLFFDVLLLTSKNMVKVEQGSAYSEIQILQ